MQQVVQEMSDNINRTAAVYEQILVTERRKQQAIVGNEIDALGKIVAREEELVALAAELEAERLAVRDRLAATDTRLGSRPRLRQVINVLDGPDRDLLAQKHQHLLDLAEQINDVNRTNFQLLRSSLELLQGVIDDVFGPSTAPNTYDPAGRRHDTPHDPTRVNQVL